MIRTTVQARKDKGNKILECCTSSNDPVGVLVANSRQHESSQPSMKLQSLELVSASTITSPRVVNYKNGMKSSPRSCPFRTDVAWIHLHIIAARWKLKRRENESSSWLSCDGESARRVRLRYEENVRCRGDSANEIDIIMSQKLRRGYSFVERSSYAHGLSYMALSCSLMLLDRTDGISIPLCHRWVATFLYYQDHGTLSSS